MHDFLIALMFVGMVLAPCVAAYGTKLDGDNKAPQVDPLSTK